MESILFYLNLSEMWSFRVDTNAAWWAQSHKHDKACGMEQEKESLNISTTTEHRKWSGTTYIHLALRPLRLRRLSSLLTSTPTKGKRMTLISFFIPTNRFLSRRNLILWLWLEDKSWSTIIWTFQLTFENQYKFYKFIVD